MEKQGLHYEAFFIFKFIKFAIVFCIIFRKIIL